MEVKIKHNEELVDATIEMVDGVMVMSPKEVKFEPKDGDVCRSSSCLYIFKTTKPSSYKIHDKVIIYHCCYNVEYNRLRICEDVGVGHIGKDNRFATEEEKQKLFDKLAEVGLEWDSTKKEFVKLKWKPNVGDTYFRPDFNKCRFLCYEGKARYDTMIYIKNHIGKGWVFKTKEECDAFCQKLNEVINQVKP